MRAFNMKSSFYFQHDYNAANDVKILYLRQQLGIEGYGIFWFVIEQLAQAGGKLPLKVIPVIAMQIQTTQDKVASIVKNYDLFEIENEEFFSVRLNEQIEFRKQLSSDGRAGALKRWRKDAENSPPISIPNSTPNAKERKGKERKGEKVKKEIVLPFNSDTFTSAWNEWLTYRKETKKTLSESAIKKQLEFLRQYGEDNAIKIINQSIMNGWQGLFEIKNTKSDNRVYANPYKTQ